MQDVKLFIAIRYLIAKKNINAVNIITLIAVFAISVATAAMFIILSVFSGLEKFNINFHSTLNPDIEISAKKGKIVPEIESLIATLKKKNEIVFLSKTIEEKAYVTYANKNDIVLLKAVDYTFHHVTPLDSLVSYGTYFQYDDSTQALLGGGVTTRLSIMANSPETIKIYMPKAGVGIIESEKESFNTEQLYPTGILGVNDQYQNYIFVPLKMGQTLLNLSPKDAYRIEIKLKPSISSNDFKEKLLHELPKDLYTIKTRFKHDASFLKVMNTEKLMIYLIFSLVLFITTFNLSGAILILILDKKAHITILSALGLEMQEIRRIFFYIGLIISFFGVITGLLTGSIIAFLQKEFGLIMANAYVPFPIEFVWQNYVFIFLIVLFLCTCATYLVSKRVYLNQFTSEN